MARGAREGEKLQNTSEHIVTRAWQGQRDATITLQKRQYAMYIFDDQRQENKLKNIFN